MSETRSIALLGGPSTGKTTYLGALVDALQLEKIHHLRLSNLGANALGLLTLAEALHEGRYPNRTAVGHQTALEALLRTTGEIFESVSLRLLLGDYAGEDVERLFRDRIQGWSLEWQQRAQSSGLVILIRPDVMTRMPRLQEAPALEETVRWDHLRGVQARPADPSTQLPAAPPHPAAIFGPLATEDVPPTPRATPSDPVIAPTALSIIELLQFIRNERGLAPGERPRDRSLPIALLVSAWDTVDPMWRDVGPARYISEHLPLLADYLWSNFLQDDVFFFGLSATGGDLNNPDYAQRYLENPSGFTEWIDPVGHRRTSQDIGIPLYWLLFGDRAFNAA